jgi:hypothetical protein
MLGTNIDSELPPAHCKHENEKTAGEEGEGH